MALRLISLPWEWCLNDFEVHGFNDRLGPIPGDPKPDSGQWSHSRFGVPIGAMAMWSEMVGAWATPFVVVGSYYDFLGFSIVMTYHREGEPSETLVATCNKGMTETLDQIVPVEPLPSQESQYSPWFEGELRDIPKLKGFPNYHSTLTPNFNLLALQCLDEIF